MTIYLGPLGNLQALPSIGRGIQATITNPAVVHQLAGRGGRVVDHPGTPKRTYALSRAWLTADELGVLEALYLGAYGPGPYVLIDPWRRNYLTPNQSAGTDVLMDTTGFVALTGAISSSTAQSDHGSRSLAWAVTAINQDVATGVSASTTASSTTADVPILPSVAYTVQVRGRLLASTGSLTIILRWYDATGAFVTSSTGSAVALSTSAFTSVTITATAPATGALLRVFVRNTAFGVATTIYLDKFQVEQAASASAWTVGTGVPRVSFDADLGEIYNVTPFADATISLIEV